MGEHPSLNCIANCSADYMMWNKWQARGADEYIELDRRVISICFRKPTKFSSLIKWEASEPRSVLQATEQESKSFMKNTEHMFRWCQIQTSGIARGARRTRFCRDSHHNVKAAPPPLKLSGCNGVKLRVSWVKRWDDQSNIFLQGWGTKY